MLLLMPTRAKFEYYSHPILLSSNLLAGREDFTWSFCKFFNGSVLSAAQRSCATSSAVPTQPGMLMTTQRHEHKQLWLRLRRARKGSIPQFFPRLLIAGALLGLSNPCPAQGDAPPQFSLTVAQGTKAPQFISHSLSVFENAGTAAVAIARGTSLSGPFTLDYSTSDGTAMRGRDYLEQRGRITFPDGEEGQGINIPILDNGLVDGPRTLTITLSNSAVLSAPITGELTILDDERPVLFDPSFNVGLGPVGPSNNPCVERAVLQPDGKVIIGGCFTNIGGLSRHGIARLNQDGSVDSSFDPGSGLAGGLAGSPNISALALQPDGKVILGGEFFRVNGQPRLRLARLHSNGSLDETFKADVGALAYGDAAVSQVIVQPDGRILVGGTFTDINGVPRPAGLARLNADGSVDTTFQPEPGVTAPLQISSVALQPDGKVLAGGMVSLADGGAILVRLNPNGSRDSAFNFIPASGVRAGSCIAAIALQPDGKILASGNFTQTESNAPNAVFRLNRDGSMDPTFKADISMNIQSGRLVLLPDGMVLLANHAGLLRLKGDGSLDRHFQVGPVQDAVVQPDGRMIITRLDESPGVARLFPGSNEPGGPEFVSSTVTVEETIGAVELKVQRLGDTSKELSVDFTTSDGTGRAGEDYVSQQGTLHFAPLEGTTAIFIPIINDSLVSGNKTFQVTLSNPSPGTVLQSIRTTTVVIESNDTGLQFASDLFLVAEDAGFGEIMVSRNGDDLRAAAVDYFMSDGTAKGAVDYLARSGTITFGPGETTKTIQIPILDDGLVEGNEAIRVALGNPKAGAVLGLRTNTTLMVVDNEIPTAVDPSFDPGQGLINVDTPASVHALGLQADGKIVVAGHFTKFNGVAQTNLARLNSNGTLDTTFRFPPRISVAGMRVEPGGGILIWGYVPQTDSGGTAGLARLKEDGSLDTNFHSIIGVSANLAPFIQTFVVQPDRKILLGGSFESVNGVAQAHLARLHPDGTLDADFKVTVRPIQYIYGYESAFVRAVVLQPDGRILVSGKFRSINGVAVNGAVRLNADGSVDLSFSPPEDPSDPSVRFLAVQKDGRILIGTPNGIARLHPDGSSDGTFIGPPKVTPWKTPDSFTLQPDGSMLFISSVGQYGVPNTVIRLKADGSLDTTLPSFTFLGLTRSNPPQLNALLVQPDGKIVVGGNFTTVNDIPRASIARLFGNGDGPPAIQFRTRDYAVAEGEGLAVISIERSGDTSRPATVQYATQDDTASANSDYLEQAGTVSFAPLETAKAIVIPILDNALPGAEKTVSLRLSNPSDGGTNVTRTTATLTIADDERPGSLDSSFNPILQTTNPYPSGVRVALQPDGKLIVGGDFQRVNGVPLSGICRLNPDGSLDASFNPGTGLALKDRNATWQAPEVFSLAVQPDGKILVGGNFNSVNGLSFSNLVRLNPDGTVDASFVPHPLVGGVGEHERNGNCRPTPG